MAFAGCVLPTSSAAAWTHFFSSSEKPFHALSLTQMTELFASCSDGKMILGAENPMDRHDAGFGLHGGGVGRRRDDEVDVAGADLLKHLRFLAELRAGKLVDRQRALAELGQLVHEDVAGDAVAGRVRLVVAEAEMPGIGGLGIVRQQ